MLLIVSVEENPQASTIIDIDENETIDVLNQMIEVQTGIPMNEQRVYFGDKLLSTGQIKDYSMIYGSNILVKRVRNAVSIHDIPADVSPEALLSMVQQHPHLLVQLKSQDSELGNILELGDIAPLRLLMMKRFMSRHKAVYARERELAEIDADPMNEANQRKIEEAIRQANVEQNMALAIENLPESFGTVHMLYVNILINDHPVVAFVDSGAQSTIMSARCAERCGLSRLIDKRFAGQARGVGTANILGRVHIAQMKFGSSYFPISITILENNDVDFLFGLDMLKRYKCTIDLDKYVLRISIDETNCEILPFLTENEIAVAKEAISSADIRMTIADSASSSDSTNAIPTAEPSASSSSSASSASQSQLQLESQSRASQISFLMGLGFSDVESASALDQANGDVDLAATLLMASR